jgi:ribosome biogenesis GTPase A
MLMFSKYQLDQLKLYICCFVTDSVNLVFVFHKFRTNQSFYFLQFLNFLQAQVRELKKTDHSSYTTTIMLVGIPNVGKSAMVNSLHQIGRISAAGIGFKIYYFLRELSFFYSLSCKYLLYY